MRYLLHLWNDGGQEKTWRASLEDLRTRQKTAFADLDDLVAFLDERTAQGLQPGLEDHLPLRKEE